MGDALQRQAAACFPIFPGHITSGIDLAALELASPSHVANTDGDRGADVGKPDLLQFVDLAPALRNAEHTARAKLPHLFHKDTAASVAAAQHAFNQWALSIPGLVPDTPRFQWRRAAQSPVVAALTAASSRARPDAPSPTPAAKQHVPASDVAELKAKHARAVERGKRRYAEQGRLCRDALDNSDRLAAALRDRQAQLAAKDARRFTRRSAPINERHARAGSLSRGGQ